MNLDTVGAITIVIIMLGIIIYLFWYLPYKNKDLNKDDLMPVDYRMPNADELCLENHHKVLIKIENNSFSSDSWCPVCEMFRYNG